MNRFVRNSAIAATWLGAVGALGADVLAAADSALPNAPLERMVSDPAREKLSVRDFRAAGDGVADDTAAINAALAKAAGKTLVFPPGNYLVSASLVPPGDTVVVISAGATVKAKPGTMWKDSGMFDVSGVSNVAIVGPGTLDGSKDANPTARTFGVKLHEGCSKVWITALVIQNVPSEGKGTNAGDGVYVGGRSAVCSDVWITANRVTGASRNGISVTSGRRIHIVGNTIERTDNYHGIDLEPNSKSDVLADVEIARNIVIGSKASGISLAVNEGAAVSGIKVTGNTVRGTTGSTYGFGVQLNASPPVTGVVISGNQIENTATHGIFVSHVSSDSVVITENVVRGARGHGMRIAESSKLIVRGNTVEAQAGSGIQIEAASRVNVSSNVIRVNGAYSGIVSYNSSENTISDNTISQERASGVPGVRISASTGGNANVVTGNRIKDFGVGISVDGKAAGTQVSGNDVLGAKTAVVDKAASGGLLQDGGKRP